jgi:hypothetical protein
MAFESGEFDLVLNRHSAFNSAEVARVLTTGGTFLTQQVPADFAEDLMAEFGTAPQWPESNPDNYVPLVEAAGLHIVARREWAGKLRVNEIESESEFESAVPVREHQVRRDGHTSAFTSNVKSTSISSRECWTYPNFVQERRTLTD